MIDGSDTVSCSVVSAYPTGERHRRCKPWLETMNHQPRRSGSTATFGFNQVPRYALIVILDRWIMPPSPSCLKGIP